jgi:molybdate transport system regulatory protein
MKISARNQIKGTICNVTEGAVNGVVAIDLGNAVVKADITMAAIEDLGLVEGKEAYAIVKVTSVMFAAASERIACLSARNQLVGTVKAVERGAVNGHVTLELEGGSTIKGSITNAAIDELGLAEGDKAIAIVKATDVMVGIDE